MDFDFIIEIIKNTILIVLIIIVSAFTLYAIIDMGVHPEKYTSNSYSYEENNTDKVKVKCYDFGIYKSCSLEYDEDIENFFENK